MKYTINSPQVISEIASGEAVIINLEAGTYYNLGEDAAKLWMPVLDGVDMEELKNRVVSPSNTGKEEVINKVGIFFAKLLEEGLIKETVNATELIGNIVVNADNLELEIYTDMQELLGLDPIHEVDEKIGWPVQG